MALTQAPSCDGGGAGHRCTGDAPVENKTLTVRATREALAKLDANPERLLS